MKQTNTILLIEILLLSCFFAGTQNSMIASEIQKSQIDDSKIVEVTIKLEGKTVKGSPKVVSAENTFAALYEKASDSTPLELEKAGKNLWRCNAVEGQEYVIGWIVKKGLFEKKSKMFGYCSEPFIAKEGLTIEFSPGMPQTFEYDLRNPPEGVIAIPAKVSLLKETFKDGKQSFLSWGGEGEIKKKGILKISGIAAGKYKISAKAKNFDKYFNPRTPFLYDERVIEIKPGIANKINPVYPVTDSTIEEGDVTIRGTVYGPDKKPLANKKMNVIPLTETGTDWMLYYPAATTDSNGKFEFTGIHPNSLVSVSSENTSISLGKESLIENAIITVDIIDFSKTLPIEKRKPIQEIIINWKSDEAGKISDLKGKIIVMDVWATWCEPCVKALPEVNSIAEEFSNRSDIVFMSFSIDYDKAIWEKTINESNWNALKHGWLDRTKNSFTTFGHPIPYALIIDKNGIVQAAGNGLDIKTELEKITE